MIGTMSHIHRLGLAIASALPGTHVRVVADGTASPVRFKGEEVPEREVTTVILRNVVDSAADWCVPNIWFEAPPARQPEPWRGGRPSQRRHVSRRDRVSKPYRSKPHRSKCGAFHRG